MKTIEVIDIVNHGPSYHNEQVIKFYYPAIILMRGKIHTYKDTAFFVRQEELRQEGLFYPTTRRKLHGGIHNLLIEVEPAPCLVDSAEFSNPVLWRHEPLEAGFDSWHGTGVGPHNRPTVTFGVRFLKDLTFNSTLNKTQCAGKYKKTKAGIYYWSDDCKKSARRSQCFHISGQIRRSIAVCDNHISKGAGFGRVCPTINTDE